MAVRPDSTSAPSRGRPSPTCSATWPWSAIGPTTPTPAWAPTSARAGWSTCTPSRPAPPRHAELTRPLPDAIADAAARAALDAPGRGHRAGPRRPLGGRRVGHLVGEVALLPGADRGGGQRPDPAGHRAGPLPHQGAGPRPAARAHRPRAPRCGRRRLRRRRQPRGAHLGSEARVGRAHQPGDAPLRAAAPPRALGDVPRAACASSCSTSCTPSAACSAATWRSSRAGCGGWPSTTAPIRCSSARRPRSARRSASPPPSAAPRWCPVLDDGSPSGPRTVALWQPPLLDVHTGARGSAHREAAALIAGPHRQRAHHARVRAQPPWGGDRGLRRAPPAAPLAGRAGAGVPRRLPRRGAPRHRGRAVRRAAHRRGGHLGARARHRRRWSRRRGDRRLPGHHRVVPAAGGPSGPVGRCVGGGARGRQRPARPVAGRQPEELLTRAPGAGGGEPRQPLRARPAPAVRRPRAPAQPRRRALVAGPARRRGPPARAGRRAGGAAPRAPPRADRGVDRHRMAQPRRRPPQRGRCAGAHRHARRGATHRRRRPRSRARAGARRCVLPPPGPALAGGRARPRGGRRLRGARRRHHLHGPAARHRGAAARRGSGSSGGHRAACSSARSRCTPRSSATSARTRSPARWSTARRSTFLAPRW